MPGKSSIRREAVDLAALACEVGEMFDPLAEEKGIQLVTDTSSPVTVTGDPSRLRQLVTNLLDNAIRFTEPGGSVTLRVDAHRGSGDAPGEGYRNRYSGGAPAPHLRAVLSGGCRPFLGRLRVGP